MLDLRTTPLAGKPLAEAIGALGRTFTSETGVVVRVQADEHVQLALRSEAELYRIAQEALQNVRKHARARAVDVRLRRSGKSVVLTIRDDGVGFNPRRVAAGRHGVVGMRERARLVGGRLRIASRPGEGTRVTASVPQEP